MRSILLLVIASAGIAHADRLVDARQVVRGDYISPRFAPDGRELLLTGPQLRGLYLAPVRGGAVRRLTDDAEAGIHARWTADGAIAYRALRGGVRAEVSIDRAGAARRIAAARPVAFAKDDRMYAVARSGAVVELASGDRFFGAVVAPGDDRVAFQGLVTGLHVYTRSTGALVHVGPGTAPAWSPDGKRLVFEVTEDDGHEVVASELYVYDAVADRVSPLTATDRVIERRPSFAPDGRAIAFDDNTGGVFVAEVAP